MTIEPTHRPLLARLIDAGDRFLARVGFSRHRLTPDVLRAEAVAAAGLYDFGPDDYEAGLTVACHAVETEGKLDWAGRAVMRAFLRRILVNRLLLVDYRNRRPPEATLLPPLVVVGLPRTGSTYLHRLLAQDSEAYGPRDGLTAREVSGLLNLYNEANSEERERILSSPRDALARGGHAPRNSRDRRLGAAGNRLLTELSRMTSACTLVTSKIGTEEICRFSDKELAVLAPALSQAMRSGQHAAQTLSNALSAAGRNG